MFNDKKFMEIVKEKGVKLSFIASQIGITNQGFINKRKNLREFKAKEIAIISNCLNLNKTQINDIFFDDKQHNIV